MNQTGNHKLHQTYGYQRNAITDEMADIFPRSFRDNNEEQQADKPKRQGVEIGNAFPKMKVTMPGIQVSYLIRRHIAPERDKVFQGRHSISVREVDCCA